MSRWMCSVFGSVRRHPWRVLSLAVMLIAAILGGSQLWAWYHFHAAEKALDEDKADEALEHITCALRFWQRGPATHLLAARIECALGHYPGAEKHLSDCIRLQGQSTDEIQLEWHLLRAQSGELPEVEQGLWECVSAYHPQSVRILEILSQVYIREARAGAAVTCLTLWLDRDPSSARPWHWRGWAREYLQQNGKAVDDYKKALELDPERWGARLRLTRLLLQMNSPQSARPHLEELVRRHGDDPDVQLLQAKVLRLEGDSEAAERLLDGLLQTHPQHLDALYLYSQLLSERDPPQYDKAEQLLRRALAVNRMDFSCLHALYKCLESQSKAKEAGEIRARLDRMEADIMILERLRFRSAGRTPTDPNELCDWGELLLRMGTEDAGLVWLHRALRVDPHHARSLTAMVGFYESKGRTKEADIYRQQLALRN